MHASLTDIESISDNIDTSDNEIEETSSMFYSNLRCTVKIFNVKLFDISNVFRIFSCVSSLEKLAHGNISLVN